MNQLGVGVPQQEGEKVFEWPSPGDGWQYMVTREATSNLLELFIDSLELI